MPRTAKKAEKSEVKDKSLDDLESLQGYEVVTVGNEDIEIRPFKFKHLLKVIKILSTITEDLISQSKGRELDKVEMLGLLASHSDVIFNVLKLSITDKDDDFFENLEADEGVELALAVWNVNQDFFIQKIQPKLGGILQPMDDESLNEEAS